MIANSAMTGAKARMADVRQKGALQDDQQNAAMALQGMKGNQVMRQGAQRGVQEMAQIGARGTSTRALATHQGQITADAAEQQNIWGKEKDNRKFGADYVMKGGRADATVQNLYNNPGTSDADISGIQQIPQKQVPPKRSYVQPKFDKDGVMRPGTGMWTTAPMSAGSAMGGGQQPGFDPGNIPRQQDLVPGELYPTAQGEMMWNGYKFVPLQ